MTFDACEKIQSQVPALQLLVALGYRPLSQADALALRGGKLRNVVLDDVLAEQVLKINHFTHKGKEYAFDLADAHEAIRRLKPTPDRVKGLTTTNQEIYDTLILGTTIAKTIGGESKSYSFRFVDWENPGNNVFHVAPEVPVERAGSIQTRRCDIVAYVNGIPFLVIENKRPTEPLKKAGSQLIGYQSEDNIPHLFHFAQMLLVMNRRETHFATVGTPWKFWQGWRDEDDRDEDIAPLIDRTLSSAEKDALFSGDFTQARADFEAMSAAGPRTVTEQDKAIFALCRPERLLDLIRRFTVFDGGNRKIARHQQYFGILAALRRVRQFDAKGARKGGVIWHTQGSGKSLTMVMLGRALVLDRDIPSPRLIIVTDRDDLDKQIEGTFRSCEMTPVRASSGADLRKRIQSKAPLITTIINKFETAARSGVVDEDANFFVLVDESHRTQTGRHGGYGNFAMRMHRMLPRACYLGFTGTPLLKKEKSTFATFGAPIHTYTIDQAVADGAVVPLLYEGRYVEQEVSGGVIDKWFERLSEGLTDEQKADLKRKFSRMDVLSKTGQAIRAKAFDISEHYRKNWQGTGLKAQLVAPSKAAAIRFKEVLDEIGHVSSEIIISPPDDNEGNEEVDKESKDLVRAFWAKMMTRYKSETDYNRQITEAFQTAGSPEILIVVSKLLTGFDAPRNTVLYLCKSLKEHTLLQAIARVNRLFQDKDDEEDDRKPFGFIMDYEGLLGELDKALTAYGALADYDANDLIGTVHDIREEIRRLPQLHDHLWGIFDPIANKKDMELLEQLLADDAVRHDFYDRLRAFSRCLHIALSSEKFYEVFSAEKIAALKGDWKQFSELKRSVQVRYQETVDVREYEPKIQKLLDDHVVAMPAETIIELVNINDPAALTAVVEEAGISSASKGDRIASATRRTISERMEEDPAIYRRFSEMLEETIRDYREKRISEREYLNHVLDLTNKVTKRDRGRAIPASIKHDDDAQACFGLLDGMLTRQGGEAIDAEETAEIAQSLMAIVKSHLIVDVWSNEVAQNEMISAIEDYCYDVLRDEKEIPITEAVLDDLGQKVMNLARARFPS